MVFLEGHFVSRLHLTVRLNFTCHHYCYILSSALESPVWIHFQKPSVHNVGDQHAFCTAKICSLSAVNSGNKSDWIACTYRCSQNSRPLPVHSPDIHTLRYKHKYDRLKLSVFLVAICSKDKNLDRINHLLYNPSINWSETN